MRFGKFHAVTLIALGLVLMLLQPLVAKVGGIKNDAADTASTSSPATTLEGIHRVPIAAILGGFFVVAGGLLFFAVRNESEHQPQIQVK